MVTLVETPMPWRGEQLQQAPEHWLYTLSETEIEALVGAATAIVEAQKPLANITPQDYPLLELSSALQNWHCRIDQGHGMVLVRGLPVRDIGKDIATAAFWLIGLRLGVPVVQNVERQTLVDIRDTGASSTDHNVRLYKTRAELSFHTDGADIIGLLCLRGSKSGGISRICSSVEVYNQVVRRRPDLAPLLEMAYHHHAHGQFGPNGPQTFAYPIVSRVNGIFRMLLLLWYIRNAAEDFPDIATLSPAQYELLDMLEQIPFEPGVALDMKFQEGDMQFLKNSVVLHARTDYEDWEDPDEKRHLLRLWLNVSSFSDGDERLRRGFAEKVTA